MTTRITKKGLSDRYKVGTETIRKRLILLGFESDARSYDEREIQAIFEPGVKLIENKISGADLKQWVDQAWSDYRRSNKEQKSQSNANGSGIEAGVEERAIVEGVELSVAGFMLRRKGAFARGVLRAWEETLYSGDFVDMLDAEVIPGAEQKALNRFMVEAPALPGTSEEDDTTPYQTSDIDEEGATSP